MAREVTDPMSEEEIEALRTEMDRQRIEIRAALADDLGGNPDDYRADRYLSGREGEAVPDGGE